jgi:hypothetical protein
MSCLPGEIWTEDIIALINDSEKNGFSGSKTISCLREYDFTKNR